MSFMTGCIVIVLVSFPTVIWLVRYVRSRL